MYRCKKKTKKSLATVFGDKATEVQKRYHCKQTSSSARIMPSHSSTCKRRSAAHGTQDQSLSSKSTFRHHSRNTKSVLQDLGRRWDATCCRECWEAVAKNDQEVVEMLLVACRSSLNTNQLCDSGDAMME